MTPVLSRGIELVDVALCHLVDAAARAQIVGLDVGVHCQELYVAPFAPAALVAPIGLPIRQLLTEALPVVPETGRINPCRRAARALHRRAQPLGRIRS